MKVSVRPKVDAVVVKTFFHELALQDPVFITKPLTYSALPHDFGYGHQLLICLDDRPCQLPDY